ncbi:hypothetical protein [Hydrogenophaga sp. 5NK40-0174]|uniref:hypothetical protein n=1 Tax=Hydrogenophaga sp. 5NK40-0174 TaxID=3127649 RepID=UPI0031094216
MPLDTDARRPALANASFLSSSALSGASLATRELIEANRLRRLEFKRNPETFYPWWRRCTVKVLLVTDGGLDFGEGDFGLSTFVRSLKDHAPSRIRFELTLAHIKPVTDAQMLDGEAGIARRIKQFRFDNASHFTADMYDEVWLFGVDPSYSNSNGRGPHLAPAELAAIHEHMQRGGGVFATGDHGKLGNALCGAIPRVRNMRYWNDFPSSEDDQNQVSMKGPKRNDSNQEGHDTGLSFSDQSDDVPQPLDLKLYSSWVGVFRKARYPHPVMCGRTGRINVFPDHPHEGEVRVPPDLNLSFGGAPEYPDDGNGVQVVPEVVATGHVNAGNTTRSTGPNPNKTPTYPHNFDVVSTYDGHRAGGVGRVACDSTWHHFVNVNLIGVVEGGLFDEFEDAPDHPSKHDGFLSSPAGQAVLAKIRNYYTNVGVWIAPPERHQCFNQNVWWEVLFTEHLVESTLTTLEVELERISPSTLMHIGTHARDVFGRRASQCQSLQWVLSWAREFIEIDLLDPWDPVVRKLLEKGDPPLPVFDAMPIVDVALGAALVSMRQAFMDPPEKITARHDKAAIKAIRKGSQYGFELASKLGVKQCKSMSAMLKA